MEEILVVGWGAVGILYGYILRRSEKASQNFIEWLVVIKVMANLYTRSNYDATKNGQIVIESHQFGTVTDFQPERVMASVAEAADRQYSYVMVTTKALPDVLSTPKLLEPFLLPSYRYPQPTYVLLQNGLGVETDLHAKLVDRIISPSPRIITAAVYCDANLVGRIMKHPSGKPRLELGLFTPAHAAPAQVELSEPNLAIFRSMVDAGGGCATISEDIQAAKFRKNIWNAVFATFSCLTRVPPSFYVATPALWEKVVPLLRETGEEVVAVGRALGYSEKYLPSDVIQSFINGDVATYNEVESQLMPSTVLDIKANKPFEVEVIVGEVVRAGRQLGISIPRMEAIYLMLSVIQAHNLKPW